MNTQSLDTIRKAKGINRSQLARLAGVSRQAVSAWFRASEKNPGHEANVQSPCLKKLCHGLGLEPRIVLESLPGLSPEERERLSTQILWDRLYPDLDSWLLAIARGEEPALARLVDRMGLFEAARIAGSVVWARFHDYKRYLHPARRDGMARLWTLQQNLGLI